MPGPGADDCILWCFTLVGQGGNAPPDQGNEPISFGEVFWDLSGAGLLIGFGTILFNLLVFLINIILLLPFETIIWLVQVLRLVPYFFFIQFDFWYTAYNDIRDKLILVGEFVILDYERFKTEYSDNVLLYTGFYVTWPVYLAFWGVLYTL